jgi:hypothetical protein
MIESVIGAAIGVAGGILLGKFACENIIYFGSIFNKRKAGLNYYKYYIRSHYLRLLSKESHDFITSCVYLMDKKKVDGYNNKLYERMESYYFKLLNYFEPLQKLYLIDTGLEGHVRFFMRSCKNTYSLFDSKKESYNDMKKHILSLIEEYSRLCSTIANSKTLLWI